MPPVTKIEVPGTTHKLSPNFCSPWDRSKVELRPKIPQSDEIIIVAFGVAGFSVIIQGLTITPLLRRVNEVTISSLEADDH